MMLLLNATGAQIMAPDGDGDDDDDKDMLTMMKSMVMKMMVVLMVTDAQVMSS